MLKFILLHSVQKANSDCMNKHIRYRPSSCLGGTAKGVPGGGALWTRCAFRWCEGGTRGTLTSLEWRIREFLLDSKEKREVS